MPWGLFRAFSLGYRTKANSWIIGVTSYAIQSPLDSSGWFFISRMLQPSTCHLSMPRHSHKNDISFMYWCLPLWCLPLLSGLLGGFTHRQGHQKWVFWEWLAQENLDWSYWTLFSFQVTPGRTVTKGLWVSKAQGYKLHKHSCRKAPTWPIICNCSWTSISIVGTAKPHSVFPPPSGALLPTPILEAKDHSS